MLEAISTDDLENLVRAAIALATEPWEGYVKRVHRASGALQNRGTSISDEEVDLLFIKNRYLFDAPAETDGEEARKTFFRLRLQEVVTSLSLPGGGVEDSGARIEILAKLSADGNGSGRGGAARGRGTRGRTPPRVAGFGLGSRGVHREEGGGEVEPPP